MSLPSAHRTYASQRDIPPFPLAHKRKRRSEFLRAEAAPQSRETRELIGSSEGLGWSGMLGLQARPHPMERTVLPTSHLFFAVPLQNQHLMIEMDGRTYEGELSANSHAIIAPGVKYALNLLDSADHFYLHIRNEVLVDVADQIFGKRLDEIDMYSPLQETDKTLQSLLSTCMHMLNEPQDSSFRSDYIAQAIIAEYFAKHTQLRQTPRVAESKIPLSRAQVQRIHDYMQANLHDSFQIADIAAGIGMSRTIFFERFVHTIKKTPNQYLQIVRVHRARQLLQDKKLSLVDIALSCGYADQSHFASSFKRLVGLSPSKYRAEIF
ncbi:AraC family transcriptional regulator [Herminiimonas sp. KBW02]|uniref:AraC family transcriptional regulator n=1 Tax=Herminiimonas sp. KBW02 TaxID=2153363 RepID=UPI000F598AF5|nr:AraC family transcriptional regulator [Herminiimonas sp. KBW02]RQO33509.1 AraC family transcriptional regulator [Herminiimonas sp. KBW02]